MPRGSSPRVRGKPVGERGRCFAGGLIPARAGKTCGGARSLFRRGAHPRACGENAQCSPRGWDRCGSSPRVRGKPEPRDDRRGVGGLIPARAGKTRRTTLAPGPPGAHPRACGENAWLNSSAVISPGSSPRVRGKRRQDRARRCNLRLIPARAGKTLRGPSTALWHPAHPRACGENRHECGDGEDLLGSSPRVRGKRSSIQASCSSSRLIPARAGKTKTSPQPGPGGTAHPRACGENRRSCTRRPPEPGSSPRVRGKRRMLDDFFHLPGLIPARAGKTYAPPIRPETSRAHPRACGENSSPSPLPVVFVGSSPRVRGKRSDSHRGRSRAGLIPARAGKTGGSVCRSRSPRAHPRACGENDAAPVRVRAMFGSSPRVRGKRPRRRARAQEDRLIPARAGKTRSVCAAARRERAHPRACGENVASASEWGGTTGSSPRVRGKPSMKSAAILAHWLIPARAGKTTAASSAVSSGGAHPRACGENVRWTSQADREGGSSPRVRGKLLLLRWGPRSRRLIPARAGKTRTGRRPRRRGPAHPRACGENHMAPSSAARSGGSSPRVRGKPLQHGRPPARGRLIPARAGKTSSAAFPLSGGAAHPRACGENWPASGMTANGAGSSPRVRGKRVLEGDEGRKVGLIPARAGKTGVGRVVLARVEAHPRACGENSHSGYTFGTGGGSSPRVRGKPLSHARRGQVLGLIPARAGKTRTPI